jgi:hypothetical protein
MFYVQLDMFWVLNETDRGGQSFMAIMLEKDSCHVLSLNFLDLSGYFIRNISA